MAGQVLLIPDGESLDNRDIAVQMMQSLGDVMAILAGASADAADVLKMMVFLTDTDNSDGMNEIYVTYFDEGLLAYSAIEVGNLPKGANVEIEAAAIVDEK